MTTDTGRSGQLSDATQAPVNAQDMDKPTLRSARIILTKCLLGFNCYAVRMRHAVLIPRYGLRIPIILHFLLKQLGVPHGNTRFSLSCSIAKSLDIITMR